MKLIRNKFDLSHENLFTCDMGPLIPVMTELAIPGDKWKMSIDAVIRVAPLLAPLMSLVKLKFWTFSVPIRLLLNEQEWANYITGGENNDDTSVLPRIVFENGINEGELGDYLNFATNEPKIEGVQDERIIKNYSVDALPFRAYALIYNEWFRNQNLQEELPVSFDMGPDADTVTNTKLINVNWNKDRFTGALPWQQRGADPVIPLGPEAPVVGNGNTLGLWDGSGDGSLHVDNNNIFKSCNNIGQAAGVVATGTAYDADVALGVTTDPSKSGLKADLSGNAGAQMNDFYWAYMLSQFGQRQARGGARLVETILSQFGVRVPDGRIQRPEYLGGSTSPLVVTPVLQTSSSDNVSPQGNMAGQGFFAQRSKQFSHFFYEHCIVMTLMSIVPATNYQQGQPAWNMYKTRFDWPWPVFSHADEQPVKNGELYVTGNDEVDYGTFGFRPIYDELRKLPNRTHAEFKSSLNYWTMTRIFSEQPKLNTEFVTSSPTKRISSVTDEHNCWCDIRFNISALRALPRRGNPSLKAGI